MADETSFATWVLYMGTGASCAGLYFWIEGKERRRAGIAVTIIGAVASLLVLKEVKSFAFGTTIAQFVGPAILLFTWGMIGYDIYLKKRRGSTAEVERLKTELEDLKNTHEPWVATFDEDKGYEIESAWYGAPHRVAVNVTPQVKELAASGKPIAANPAILLGNDPWPGVLKSLKVTFSIVQSDGKEVFLPSLHPTQPPIGVSRKEWPYLTAERELAELSDSPAVQYKNKIRVILRNTSGKEVQVWTPLWDDSSEVKCQWPLGTSLQAAGPKGWLAGDWMEEQSALKVQPNSVFRCWIGLMPPIGDSIERRAPHQKNGTLIFPVKVENELFESRVKI